MKPMKMNFLLKEYDIEIDDIRWYLASLLTEKFLSFRDNKHELNYYIWSGKLEEDLYNMEEKFLLDMNDQFEKNLLDEATLRELLSEISNLKSERSKKGK